MIGFWIGMGCDGWIRDGYGVWCLLVLYVCMHCICFME